MRQRANNGQGNSTPQPPQQGDSAEILMQMKQELDQKKSQVSTLEGKRDVLYQQLERDFKCNTVADADKRIASMDKELDDKKQRLEQRIQALRTDYNWDFDNANVTNGASGEAGQL